MSETNETNNPRGTNNPGALHHRLYRWVLHWADTRYGLPALIILAFAESSFFPVPPDVLLLPLCLGQPKRAFRFAFWCSVASMLRYALLRRATQHEGVTCGETST